MLSSVFADLDRKDLLWVGCGTALGALFALVAYDQLFNLHFMAWRLYPSREATEPLAAFLQGPVSGWYRPFVIVLAGLAGLFGSIRMLGGHWKALAGLALGLLLVIVAVEISQSAGQEATPTTEVEQVAAASVVWTALLGLTPLLALVVSVVGLARRDVGDAPSDRVSSGA